MASLNFDLRLLYPRTTSDFLPQVRCTVLATGRRRTIPVIVKITDLNDNAPVFRGTPYTLTLPEDTPVGTTVFRYRVIPNQCRVIHPCCRGLNATDEDSGSNGQVEYSLVPGDGGEADGYEFFAINLPHQVHLCFLIIGHIILIYCFHQCHL